MVMTGGGVSGLGKGVSAPLAHSVSVLPALTFFPLPFGVGTMW